MQDLVKRLTNLLTVKSLVTIILISADFMTIYTVVIAFYFGTQSEKNSNKSNT